VIEDSSSAQPGIIQLPQTCPQNKHLYTHVGLLTKVTAHARDGAGFECRLYKSGARVPAKELGKRPVLIEAAGPQGQWKPGKHRENLWLLWRYDWERAEWKEIARAVGYGRDWVHVLRDAVICAMRPVAATEVAAGVRGREVAASLLTVIDEAMVLELPAVRVLVLNTIYDGLAGRVAAA
jgi:hypothetical protein